MKIIQKKHPVIILVLMLVLIMTGLPVQGEVFAAKKSGNLGTATLQILSTSDLHGKSVRYSYDTGLESNGSLAQLSTMINQKKAELTNGTTFLVDSGDTIYGYGTQKIYDGSVTGDEYMFHLMKQMGYDVITLGNHDFNFGYDYLMQALNNSGMTDKAVLANVVDARTKKPILAPSRIISKKMTTSKGEDVSVKIGVIGVMTPSIIDTSEFKGVLESKDILTTVKEEAAALSGKTDLIIVLAHSGVGTEAPAYFSDNMVYALSQVDDIDVICAGHNHLKYPDTNSPYYEFAGVDSSTGLMNGTVVVEEPDHGLGLGVSKLKLKFNNGLVEVVKQTEMVEDVTEDVVEDQAILDTDAAYASQYAALYAKSLSRLQEAQQGANGYFGTFEDNALIQAVNEAKIRYGLQNLEKGAYGEEYKSYPIISVTSYEAGGRNPKDYLSAGDDVTVEDCLNLQKFGHDMAVAYEVKGSEIREALEWEAARIFQVPGALSYNGNDANISAYTAASQLVSWLQPQNEVWKGFGVYDGIEYEIDTTQPARYADDGSWINDSHRISKLTRNGLPVADNDRFVLIASKEYIVHHPKYGTSFANKRKIMNNGEHIEKYLEEYVHDSSARDVFDVKPDHNFRVKFDENTNYLVKSSEASQAYAATRDWYMSTLGTADGYAYYMAHFTPVTKDTTGPMLVLASMNQLETNRPIKIKAEASDISGLADLKYLKGVYTETDPAWNSAQLVENAAFTVSESGTYSVRARDYQNNVTVKYITISNYKADVLQVPDVDTITNKKEAVAGTADPGATVYVKINGVEYSAAADDKGAFSCQTGYQLADTPVEIWQVLNGRQSSVYQTTVIRRGGNQPNIYGYTNTMLAVTGDLKDNQYTYPIAVCGNQVFIPENKEDYYTASDYYVNHQDRTVVKCAYTYDQASGQFQLFVPVQNAGVQLTVYIEDWIGRHSVATKVKTEEVAPNMPVLYDVLAEEGKIYGRIPNPVAGRTYKLTAEQKSTLYVASAGDDGLFVLDAKELEAGKELKVTAEDMVDGQARTSAACKVMVQSAASYGKEESELSIDPVNNKDLEVTGTIDDYDAAAFVTGQSIRLVTDKGTYQVLPDEDGDFTVELDRELPADSWVYLLSRDEDYQLHDYQKLQVSLAKPAAPEFMTEEIRAKTTKKLKVYCDDKAKLVVKVGSQSIEVNECQYKAGLGGYVYKLKLDAQTLKAKQICRIYMENAAGKSKTVKMKVKKSLKPKKTKKKNTKK